MIRVGAGHENTWQSFQCWILRICLNFVKDFYTPGSLYTYLDLLQILPRHFLYVVPWLSLTRGIFYTNYLHTCIVRKSLSDCWIWRRKVDVVPIPYDSLRDGRGIPLSLRKLAMLLEQNFFLISSNFRAKTLSYTFDYTLSGVTLVRRKWQFFCSDKNIVRQII